MLEIIALIISLTIPGYLAIRKEKFDFLEKLILGVFLSIAITSFIYYSLTFFVAVNKTIIFGYSLILLILFSWIEKEKIRGIIKDERIKLRDTKIKKRRIKKENLIEVIGLFLLTLIIVFTCFFVYLNNLVIADEASFHLPTINDYAEDGEKTFYENPKNLYEVMSNQFPLLFESFTGINKILIKERAWKLFPLLPLIISIGLIYLVGRENGKKNSFSLLIYSLSPIVIILSWSFYVELFLVMIFLGAVYFLLKYIESVNKRHLIIASFLMGLLILTKLSGIIFVMGLLFFLLYKRKPKQAVISVCILFLVLITYTSYLIENPTDKSGLGDYGKISEDLLVRTPKNFLRLGELFYWFFSSQAYFPLIPFLFLLSFFWIEKKERNILELTLICLVFFIFFTVISASYPTKSGFHRYFIPLYALICVISGNQIKKMWEKNKRLFFIVGCLSLSIMVYTSALLVLDMNNILLSEGKGEPKLYSFIPNDSNVNVWYINGAAKIHGLEKTISYDFISFEKFDSTPCEFLKEKKINRMVYYHNDELPRTIANKVFGKKLKESLDKNECSELIVYFDKSLLKTAIYKIK